MIQYGLKVKLMNNKHDEIKPKHISYRVWMFAKTNKLPIIVFHRMYNE